MENRITYKIEFTRPELMEIINCLGLEDGNKELVMELLKIVNFGGKDER